MAGGPIVFRTLIFCACLVGLVAGLALTAVQAVGVTPIILAAEKFEVVEEAASAGEPHSHDEGAAGHHSQETWAPQDGVERTLYSAVANILAGIGFAAVVLALMRQLRGMGWVRVSPMKGVLWGIAGFIVIFLAPAIGLPPEIPGAEAAVLGQRQGWWLLAVTASGIGLGIVALAPVRFKLAGVLILAVPHLVGAPHHGGPVFTHPDAGAVAALNELHHQFILASGVTNLVFWLVTGVLSAALFQRYIQDSARNGAPNAA
ncbi:hypothetical protein EQG41_20385 [Billgrantia azerbaijanica]|nr:hypothetical protein EQG41_20385 [Halomonas azerbaijanica]